MTDRDQVVLRHALQAEEVAIWSEHQKCAVPPERQEMGQFNERWVLKNILKSLSFKFNEDIFKDIVLALGDAASGS